MKRWVGRIFKWIGVCTVLVVGLVFYVILKSDEKLPEAMVIEVDFRRGVVEHISDHPLAVLKGSSRLSVREQVLGFVCVALDECVGGLMGGVGGGRMSFVDV